MNTCNTYYWPQFWTHGKCAKHYYKNIHVKFVPFFIYSFLKNSIKTKMVVITINSDIIFISSINCWNFKGWDMELIIVVVIKWGHENGYCDPKTRGISWGWVVPLLLI